MNMNFLHPSAAGGAAASRGTPLGPAAELITEPSARAGSACCCPARPAVRVIMPPSPSRPRSTEILLCGHHYRVSKAALAAARAVVYELAGTPEDIASWVAVERAGTAASLT